MFTADDALAAYPEPARQQRRVREPGVLLANFVAAADLRETVDALVDLARWLRAPDRRLCLPDGRETGPAHRRAAVLAALLEAPSVGLVVRGKVQELLGRSSALKLFAEAGLPNDRGLAQETVERLFRLLLPVPRDDDDLAALLPRLFPKKSDLAFLQGLPPDLFAALATGLVASAAAASTDAGASTVAAASTGAAASTVAAELTPLRAALDESIVLLGARIQGLGLSEGIRDRGQQAPLSSSPFFALPRALDAALAPVAIRSRDGEANPATEPAAALLAEVATAIAGCRRELAVVLARLEAAGVSLDVVYTIEVIEQSLNRLEVLLAVRAAPPGPIRLAAMQRLLQVLVRARIADRSVRDLAYTNLHLLARKLVERAGKTGEHYITTTRREYLGMLARAAGGGLLTAGTAIAKLKLGALSLSPFVAGVAASVNYAASFVLIQLCGFTLATKQPSMTAAALAGTLGAPGPERLADLVAHTARIVRSQLAAAIGNVTTVAITAALVSHAVHLRTGGGLIGSEKANAVLASLDPLRSGTALFAVLTGVILWTASLVGGWLENFAACRRLPQAIAEHGASRFLGQRTMRWASDFFARHISGFGTSVALGVMLGMTPSLAVFFGLPIDVRHVTLATGQLAIALFDLGWLSLTRPDAMMAYLGIVVIFVCNLGTSFFLALMVAMRAREVPRRDRWGLITAILRHFARRPLDFIVPPRSG